MNRSRLLMIGGLALAIGLLVSYTVYNQLRTRSGANQHMVNVVVAAHDIQIGARLTDRDVTMAAFPQASIPPGAFFKVKDVLGRGAGRGAVLPIGKGDFVLPYKLAADNTGGGLPSLIPQGMRAVSVRVNDVVSVAGFVQPGTSVDVLSTGNSGGNGERQTTTVLENVAVAAVGKNLDPNAPPDAQPAPVITLFVSPDDAQKLALATQEGRIQLALRNPLDTKKDAVGATRASSIYPGGAPAPSTEAKPKPHKVVAKAAPPPPPQPYGVEMIRGSKRDETKFQNDEDH
jgi:pilus assembly protein CpaB